MEWNDSSFWVTTAWSRTSFLLNHCSPFSFVEKLPNWQFTSSPLFILLKGDNWTLFRWLISSIGILNSPTLTPSLLLISVTAPSVWGFVFLFILVKKHVKNHLEKNLQPQKPWSLFKSQKSLGVYTHSSGNCNNWKLKEKKKLFWERYGGKSKSSVAFYWANNNNKEEINTMYAPIACYRFPHPLKRPLVEAACVSGTACWLLWLGSDGGMEWKEAEDRL